MPLREPSALKLEGPAGQDSPVAGLRLVYPCVLSTLFHRVFGKLTKAVLTAIVPVAIMGLINFREIARPWRVSRLEKVDR